jgi:putative transposase
VEQAGTILYNTQKDIEIWEKYIHCMVEKHPLRTSAQICSISLQTAFYWRHKILGTLQNMMDEVELDCIVEADETYSTVSYKRHHRDFKLPRPAHKRGTPAGKRGLSKEQVCVPCGVNLDGKSVARISNLGKPSLKDPQKVLSDKVAAGSVFVTDSLKSYQKLSLDMNLSHIRIPRGRRSVGTFNIQTINSYYSRLKNLIVHRFKGVATKYLNNYLVYHNFMNFAKDTAENKEAVLLNFIRNTPCTIKSADTSKRPAVPV